MPASNPVAPERPRRRSDHGAAAAGRRRRRPGDGPQPADRIAPDAERHLIDRLYAQSRGRGADLRAGYFFLAGVAFIIGSIMDTLDGRYSRMSGKGTAFGAFLDSTALDRLEEGIVLIAVGAYFASQHDQVAAGATVAAVLGSLMVSYTRARAEALGVECKVGLATRPVRVVILSAGLIFARGASLGHFELLAPAVLRPRRTDRADHDPANRPRPLAAQNAPHRLVRNSAEAPLRGPSRCNYRDSGQ